MSANDNALSVPRWLDMAGHLVERFRPLFVRMANLESVALAQTLRKISVERPIYICGLARAGSTILLKFLAAHPETASHRYRDFPFVHIPYWWDYFLEQAALGEASSTERFHEDRIEVSPDSPEAMEEQLWVTFFRDCHDPSRSNVLDKDSSHPAFERFYRDHIRKVMLVRSGKRYLAKNNYNLSRIGYLKSLFPDVKIIVPVRDPVGHIASSMRQHRIFSEKQRRDRRTRDYLRRAAHFEFGLDRRPINVQDNDTIQRIQKLWSQGNEALGWAHYWSSMYSFVADSLEASVGLRNSVFPVHYDDLCRDSRQTLTRLYGHCELQVEDETLAAQADRLSPPSYYDRPFSDETERKIRRITDDTHNRIRNFC